ncbi:MAG: hypothetical protein JWQ64_99 [Subtercola sp.]|nr:hypothetical protein [Subtercola sp.]
MKISKKVVAPVLALLAAIAIATAGASSAQASRPVGPNHKPIVCMLGGGSGISIEWGCGWTNVGGGGTADNAWGYDRTNFVDTKDFSPWEVVNNPRLFPNSDSGYNCVAGDEGSALCTRSSAAAPKPGIDNAKVSQLANGTIANTGSVLNWEERDQIQCTDHEYCFETMVDYTKYHALARYAYDSPGGTPYVTGVWWYKNDGKGAHGQGTFIGTSKHFLTSSVDDLTDAATMIAGDGISANTATTTGGDVAYQLNVMAQTAGSAIVHVKAAGFTVTDNRQIPAGWISLPTTDLSEAAYLVPNLAVNEPQTAWIHFTVTGASGDIITADVNGVQTSQTLTVRPDAPTCTTADRAYNGRAVVPTGGAVTVLDGVFCSFQSDSTLKVWTGDQRGAGTLALVGTGNTRAITYQAPSADYAGDDTVYVYAVNSAGVASQPTAVPVTVAAPATAAADSYTVAPGATLNEDAGHGMLANEQFNTGTEGWTLQQGYAPANGDLSAHPDGSFSYTPHAGFAGDDTFRYRLNGPHGQVSNVVTVTIHVAN